MKSQQYSFNNKRCRLLAGSEEACTHSSGVAYYMQRDNRVQDNWAFIYSQDLAIKHNLPLYVLASLNVKHPENPEATRRAIDFTLGGLQSREELWGCTYQRCPCNSCYCYCSCRGTDLEVLSSWLL